MAVLPGAQRVKLGFDAATGAFRGYAHVEFTTPEQLAAVVKAGSASVLGRTVKVTYSKEKPRIAGNASGPKRARRR
jgi:RNA recognition motif-containing protein